MRKLDFLVLGAQKSGTTTLFQLLSEHPSVFVPPGKELPFFNGETVTEESYAEFIAENFCGHLDDSVIGKLTPHYLSDPRVPERILSLSSETRLAVILRDPVERAFSHYRMSRRRKIEERSFAEAIDDMLVPETLEQARTHPTGRASENKTYVVWGEYGRLIRPYAKKIEAGEFLILSTKDLEATPGSTTEKLCTFLGLNVVSLPSLGKRMHQGGVKERLPLQSIAKSLAPTRWLWRRIPRNYKARILFKIDQWNVVKSSASLDDVPQETVARLRAHFLKDAEEIERLTGWRPDWIS
jgi:hypothetical protein